MIFALPKMIRFAGLVGGLQVQRVVMLGTVAKGQSQDSEYVYQEDISIRYAQDCSNIQYIHIEMFKIFALYSQNRWHRRHKAGG